MLPPVLLPTFIPIAILATLIAVSYGDETTTTTTTEQGVECFLWLAPSTLEGAGLGMFAGKDFVKDEPLADDLVVPIVDLVLQNGGDGDFTFLWDEYVWNADSVLMDHECFSDCNGASPGFGSTANSFLPLVNVEEGLPDQDNAGLHRSRDPGAGAFTQYHNRESTATRNIAAGEELYVDYGSNWFEQREFLGPIPLYHDLRQASLFYRKFRTLHSTLKLGGDGGHDQGTEKIMNEIWSTFVADSDFPRSRVLGSFHHDKENELDELNQHNGSLEKLRRKQSQRSVDWLRQHGTCGDHMQPGPSTLPQAGRGAFATRDLPKGTIVAQLPLIHVTQRFRLDTYPVVQQGKRAPTVDRKGKKNSQLLVNYCYGHEESTLLLCPYGPVVNFVNHNQTQANVRLTWGDPVRGNHMPHLLEAPLDELEADKTAKLAFEMVATRDIEKGEEIFLDYGDEWESAWNDYVKKWKPPEGSETYVSAFELNQSTERLRTEFEQLSNPYPANVELECLDQFFHSGWEQEYKRNLKLTDERRSVDILRYEETDDGELFYTVVDHWDDELHEGLPREAFRFVDSPHTTDMFLENAFRHDIGIPESMFPEAWKNNASK